MSSGVRVLVGGTAQGPLLWLEEPISFWGGVDPDSGRIVDRHHPQFGCCLTDMIVALPHGRGSSSSPSVLAEMIRLGTAPAGIVLAEPDPMIVLGSLVAAELYAVSVPVVVLGDGRLRGASRVELGPDDRLKFH